MPTSISTTGKQKFGMLPFPLLEISRCSGTGATFVRATALPDFSPGSSTVRSYVFRATRWRPRQRLRLSQQPTPPAVSIHRHPTRINQPYVAARHCHCHRHHRCERWALMATSGTTYRRLHRHRLAPSWPAFFIFDGTQLQYYTPRQV